MILPLNIQFFYVLKERNYLKIKFRVILLKKWLYLSTKFKVLRFLNFDRPYTNYEAPSKPIF